MERASSPQIPEKCGLDARVPGKNEVLQLPLFDAGYPNNDAPHGELYQCPLTIDSGEMQVYTRDDILSERLRNL